MIQYSLNPCATTFSRSRRCSLTAFTMRSFSETPSKSARNFNVCILAARVDESGQRCTILGFVDATVYFVAQPVVDGQIRPRLPGVLKVEVISLAADRSFVETVADGGDVRGGDDPV